MSKAEKAELSRRFLGELEDLYQRSGIGGLEEKLKKTEEHYAFSKTINETYPQNIKKLEAEVLAARKERDAVNDMISQIKRRVIARYDAKSFFQKLCSDIEYLPEETRQLHELETRWKHWKDKEWDVRRKVDRLRAEQRFFRRRLSLWELRDTEKLKIIKRAIQDKRQAEAEAQALTTKVTRLEGIAARSIGETRGKGGEIRDDLLANQLAVYPNCPYCGGELSDPPHADHIMPVNHGGLSTPQNMVLVCDTCNLRKHDKTLREFILKYGLCRERIEEVLEMLGKRF